MPNLTQLITRQSGLQAWYSLDTETAGGVSGSATVIDDVSGNARDLTAIVPAIDVPQFVINSLNGRGAVVHDDETDILQFTGAMSVRDVFVVGKIDDTPDFGDPFRGFITGLTTTTDNALLIGVGSTTRFLSIASGAANMGYLLDDVLQADGTRTAPFDAFRRMRLSTSGTAMNIDGIQFGRDRLDVARLFKGKWADAMFWNPQRTAGEARAIALYYDLKFNLWRTNGTTLNFPDPDMTGIKYRRFYEHPKKWDNVILSHEYADEGRSFNRITDTPTVEWTVEFDCVSHTHALAKTQYEIFDSFWDAVGIDRAFSFTDKYGTTHTNIRVKDYSRSHSKHKSWQNEVEFRLCKYP